ncbi:MAG: hypothetical protein GXY33_22520 [Phycisphaerae bacterium]|nr:hypothetical protein [Phycisphaerae bacterium]
MNSANVTLRRPEAAQAQRWADQLQGHLTARVYPESFVVRQGVTSCVYRLGVQRMMGLIWDSEKDTITEAFSGEPGQINLDGQMLNFKACPTDAANSTRLREYFPFTRPTMAGLGKSFGCGDRLGISTPGHIMASRRHRGIFPILAQQSIREMTRTNRAAQEVMDDACWGVFQAGFDQPFGSDADHLKTLDDIETCVKAGFLMFTIDPGDHVDDGADTEPLEKLESKFETLPWDELESSPRETVARYEKAVDLPTGTLDFSAEQVIRAAVKYGRAVAHTLGMYRRLVTLLGEGNFELEVSVDETATPTTPQEHYYVASELRRLGVRWVSLAPRFVGEFEKGVDYIGDLGAFRAKFKQHAAIAKALGPYKMSIHSGSDKFSIYPIVAEIAGQMVHVKTAGTSYLEALRVLSQLETELFREILDFARQRYETDRASYHVSAKLSRVPAAEALSDHQLPRLLDDFDAREVLHVTFGSVMTTATNGGVLRFRDRLIGSLTEHEEAYHQTLERHIGRHMELLK